MITPALLLLTGFAAAQQTLSVYRGAQAELFGRAPDRNSLLTVSLDDFMAAETLPVLQPLGVPTAVVFSSLSREALEEITKAGPAEVEGSVIERKTVNGLPGYRFSLPRTGFEVSFALEKPDKPVLDQIGQVYRKNLYWRRAVMEHYQDNYIIRIFEAKNVLDPGKKAVTFEEVLLTASFVGDSDQWLWGIHDGFGVFNEITFEVSKRQNWFYKAYDNYRDYRENAAKMYNRIRNLEQIDGDFVENLLMYLSDRTAETELTETLVMPEEFIETGFGSPLDFACFVYDILRRKRMEPVLLAMKNAGTEDYSFLTAYRTGKDGLWSGVSRQGLVKNAGDSLSSLGMAYTILDAEALFTAGRFINP